MAKSGTNQVIFQAQNQRQTLSHRQIQALQFLTMNSLDLREAIYKEVSENPALEIVKDNSNAGDLPMRSGNSQQMLENSEYKKGSLQQHLMHQLNAMNLSDDEYALSQKLIYNLDKNGCYGSSISPENLIDKTRPLQNAQMLAKCIERIQKMDPVGTCCRTLEESLLVQARLSGHADVLSLFILDGHIELLNPPEVPRIKHKLLEFRENWHKKAFAPEIPLDNMELSEQNVQRALQFILTLNPRPAQGYFVDSSADYEKPDVVLTVERQAGRLASDEVWHGMVSGDDSCHFQVKYASGVLPELRIAPDFYFDKENVARAQEFIQNLAYRENTLVLQCCCIVSEQKEFFLHGPGHLKILTRRHVAQLLGIHESTMSRSASKNNSKYIQTEYGLFPISYFFTSGVQSTDGRGSISAEAIKKRIFDILSTHADEQSALSDSELTRMLNEEGIKIARRTVAKYRATIGIKNSYKR